jgi:predicted Ser/Thr protein kinase
VTQSKERVRPHVTPERLAAFERGDLPEDSIAQIEAHLSDCGDCCDALAALPADEFLSRLRAARAGASAAGTPLPATLAQTGPPPAPAPAHVPALPGFEDLRELGRGGMGVVYAARHAVMGRRVAVKLINGDHARHPAAVERFRREARAAARLSHPNIVTAYDAGQDGDRPFLVMELIDGESLAERLRRDGPLSVAEACAFVRQAALGLQHAHDNGLVHRDVKPHNLMLAADGTVKVLDFGLAALAGDGGRTTGHTAPHAVMGTPDYMAPEQAEDACRADGRADVYSLGCTLYHLLTGTVPFPEDSTLLKLLAHRTRPRPSTRAARPDVPAWLDAALRKAMARRPDDRYQTPGEFADALAAGEGRSAASRRRRTLLAAAALLVLTGIAAAGVIRVSADRDRDLVIQVEDSDFDVVVKGEHIVRILDRKTGKAYQLDRTDLTLSLADDPDGLAVTLDGKESVVLKRQGQRIAVVRVEAKTKPTHDAEGGFRRLFNGKDLTGWVVDGGDSKVWRAEDGELVAKAAKYPDTCWLLTERSYSDFVLRFEF